MKIYALAFRLNLVKKMLGPQGQSAHALSKEVGIPQPTLSRWLRQAQHEGHLPREERRPLMLPSNPRTPEQRLRLVFEAASLPHDQLGSFLRKEGLHQADLDRFREEIAVAYQASVSPPSTDELARLKRENRLLSKELRRKDAALAEAAALLVLQKKIQTLWEDEGAST